MLALVLACAEAIPSVSPDPPDVDRAVVAEPVPQVQTHCFVDADGDGWGGEARVVEGAIYPPEKARSERVSPARRASAGRRRRLSARAPQKA